MNIGRVGIWSMALEAQPLSVAQEATAELDELGFPALWVPEALGKEVMSHAALLLAATRRWMPPATSAPPLPPRCTELSALLD